MNRWTALSLLGLGALVLPDMPMDLMQGGLPAQADHWLGTDALGRDGVLRLLQATARSLGFATAVAWTGLGLALLLALGEPRLREARSALRAVPALLVLLPLAAATGGLGWISLGLLLAALLALHQEPPLAARVAPMQASPAWQGDRLLGLHGWRRARKWAPWALAQATPLYPGAWLGALWSEAALRLLGLGPSPQSDSLGLLLQEELPRLATDATALGWAALAMVLALAWLSTPETP